MSRTRRVLVMFVIAIAAFALGATTVVVAAGPGIYRTGEAVTKVKTATNTMPFVATDPSAMDLPGARLRFTLPDKALMTARFAAATHCHGAPGRCHAQVAIFNVNAGGSPYGQIYGVAHMDSTFGADGHESHVAEGSIILPAGVYDFQVQLTTFLCCDATGSVTIDIPMWHLTMERISV